MKSTKWQDQPLDRHSPIPLYQQLGDLLADAIRKGQFQEAQQLPSENELIGQFNVSRSVVRQTFDHLSRQGLIYTEQGRGSFVAAQKIVKSLDILQSYHAGMKKAGINVDTRIMTKSLITPPDEISQQLAVKHGEKVMLLERVAYANGSPLNLLISHIALGSQAGRQLMKFEGGSLYDFLAKEFNIHLNSSRNMIEITFAGEYESRLLHWARGSALLQILGISYDQNGKPVEHSRVVYPGSMFRFQFDSFKLNKAGSHKPVVAQ